MKAQVKWPLMRLAGAITAVSPPLPASIVGIQSGRWLGRRYNERELMRRRRTTNGTTAWNG